MFLIQKCKKSLLLICSLLIFPFNLIGDSTLEQVTNSKIKAVAAVESIKILSQDNRYSIKRIQFRLEKKIAGTIPAAFYGRCKTLDYDWQQPGANDIIFTPKEKDRVYVTITFNDGWITSYTPITPRLEESLSKNPDDLIYKNGQAYPQERAETYIQRGAYYFTQKQYSQGLANLNAALEIEPGSPEAYYYIGRIYLETKEYEAAASSLSQALTLKSSFTEAYYYRGKTYTALRKYQKAVQDFTSYTELNPEDINGYLALGIVYRSLNQPQRAIKEFDKLLSMERENAYTYYQRGLSFAELHEYTKAVKDFTWAIAFNSNNPDAYYQRGLSYIELSNYTGANSDFTKVIEFDKNTKTAYYYRGITNYKLLQIEKAIHDFTAVISRDIRFKNAYYYRGLCYWQAGNLNKAITDYETITNLEDDSRIYKILAILYYQRQSTGRDLYQAELYIKKVLTLDTKDLYIPIWLYLIGTARGSNMKNILEAYYRFIDEDIWVKNIYDLYLGKSTPKECITQAENPIYKGDTGKRLCEAYFYTGRLFYELGEKEKALYYIVKALQTNEQGMIEYTFAKETYKKLSN